MKSRFFSKEELPLTFPVSTLAEILGINLTRAYELARSKNFSLKIGKRFVIIRDRFFLWLDEQAEAKKRIS